MTRKIWREGEKKKKEEREKEDKIMHVGQN
jgi:hypothetical protein